jgi:hypothetical protein
MMMRACVGGRCDGGEQEDRRLGDQERKEIRRKEEACGWRLLAQRFGGQSFEHLSSCPPPSCE